MKKIIPTLMALVLVLSMFTACSLNDKTAGTDDNKSSATTDSDIPDNDEITELFKNVSDVQILYGYSDITAAVTLEFGEYEESDIIIENSNIIIKPTDYDWEKDYGGRTFVITNIKYQQALDKYSKLLTGNALDYFMNRFFYNYNDLLCYRTGGGLTGLGIKDISVTYTGQNNNENSYEYNVEYAQMIGFTDNESETNYENFTSHITVKKTIDGYRISETDFAPGQYK